MATRIAPRARLSAERRFFLGMAVALAVTAFIGFAPTYYLSAWSGAKLPVYTPAVHLHGALCTAWVLLLVLQAGLVTAGRREPHMTLGLGGVLLIPAIFVSGLYVAMHSGRRVHSNTTDGTMADPYVFFAFPFFAVSLFALFAAAAVAMRGRSDFHKRLMLIATTSLVGPAVARIFTQLHAPVVPAIGALAAINLFLVALVAFDLSSRGRLHPATLWAGGLLLISEPLRVLLAFSTPWQAFARAMMS